MTWTDVDLRSLTLIASSLLGCAQSTSVELTFSRDDHGSAANDHDSSEPISGETDVPEDPDAGSVDADTQHVEPPDALGCYLYIEALCGRIAECRNLPAISEGCLAAASGCAELATGAADTNSGLRECAAAYSEFSCDLLLRGRRLECISKGARKAGEVCSLALNCESLVCDYRTAEQQYVCSAIAEPGAPCSTEVACPLGNSCVAGTCEPSPPPDFDNGNLPLGATGAACRDPHQCQLGLFCLYEGAEALGRCAPAPGAGAPCGVTRGYDWAVPLPAACDQASHCVDGACELLPGAGEPCAESSFVDQPPCAAGSFCDESAGTCATWKALGEPCVGSSQRSGLSGLPLDPECTPENGARCLCADGTETCAEDERRCRIRVNPGADCDFEFATCVYGTSCVDGRCDYPQTDD